jgi:AmiR/NasT family two-component response regulator
MHRHWNVALIGLDIASRAKLRGCVEEAGGCVSVELDRWPIAPSAALEEGIDIVIGDVAGASGGPPPGECPVVLVTDSAGEVPHTALRARDVMGVRLKPVRADHLRAVLDVSVARFAERRDLERRLDDRKVIERAKGRVMEQWAIGEDAAFRLLRRAAMDSRRRLADVPREILAAR